MAMLARLLKKTPLHPQWLVLRKDNFHFVSENLPEGGGMLLDLGCGRGGLKNRLKPGVSYLGLDHPATGLEVYHGNPDILATASQLPLADGSLDAVACLDVLEHLPEPQDAVSEMGRVLRPGGLVYLSVPFAYPLHDQPWDYQRLTAHQIRRFVEEAGLEILSLEETGNPLESAALLANLAIARTSLDALSRRSPFALLTPVLLALVPLLNLLGLLLAATAGSLGTGFLPMGYEAIARKPDRGEEHP